MNALLEFTTLAIKLAQSCGYFLHLGNTKDRCQTRIEKRPSKKRRSELKGRMSSFLMFLPNMVMLLGRLLKDSPVCRRPKRPCSPAAIVYVISPLDLIPDVFPFIGQVDDLYVVALVAAVDKSDE